MVSIKTLVAALASVGIAQACVRTCETSGSSSTTCSYTCWRACSDLSETTVRNSFLSALQANGHACSAVGANGVRCTKNSRFGACNTHYWNCGKDC
ncbi:kinetochore complex Sim4 subunit Fta4 [Podospora australis]|uniref:Kinetochore complex Sim4 subunit Fta4 n=1 Tax=Podospora australis TaxID=1536484 RepID=A0AAN7ADS8_9PEZI|nr:kinetochore complex Sim4 subunit Fta4 [Podospora australis]